MPRLLLAFLLTLPLFGQGGFSGGSSGGAVNVPVWKKFIITKVAPATQGCASGNGCWIVRGAATQAAVAAAAALSQAITVSSIPTNSFIHYSRTKTVTACAGATTITVFAGTQSTPTSIFAIPYDLKAAVSDTNFISYAAVSDVPTVAAINMTATITTTVENVSDIAAGCSFHLWVSMSRLQP